MCVLSKNKTKANIKVKYNISKSEENQNHFLNFCGISFQRNLSNF